MSADPFASCRPRLLGVAYGILGELGEAEDVVQDAWLRWQGTEREGVRDPTAFLVTVTTRRARRHVGDESRARRVSSEERERLATAFLTASLSGDVDGLRDLLAADAIMYTDGGGVVIAARKPIYGADKIARFMVGIQNKDAFPADPVFTRVLVNGDPGVLMETAEGEFLSIVAVEVGPGAVDSIRFFNNPERFAALAAAFTPRSNS